MRIAILGAGFTGLTAALRLLQMGHQVTIFEKEDKVGGLAAGFKESSWQWSLERSYHHWFTCDKEALNLAREIGHPVIIKRPLTNVFVKNQQIPFDSPGTLLKFPYLSFPDRFRTGLITFYLKYLANPKSLEGKKALPWLNKWMGESVTTLIWEPLFTGKFGDFKESIALTWFWARIKKRTPSLAYPEGGFQTFADQLAKKVEGLGGKIYLNTEVFAVSHQMSDVRLKTKNSIRSLMDKIQKFDKVIVTLPTPIFTHITPNLPASYIKRINSIPHLSALNLILILKKPFMDKTYWLNITQKDFPFLVLAEHTNFMDKNYYGNQHILYIGNYLPPNHPYLKMTPKELLKTFDPYLKKINPTYHLSLITYHLFSSPFAQPIVTPNYPQLIPQMETPLKNVYLANLSLVYPWDRGTNYAIEMGERVAELVNQK